MNIERDAWRVIVWVTLQLELELNLKHLMMMLLIAISRHTILSTTYYLGLGLVTNYIWHSYADSWPAWPQETVWVIQGPQHVKRTESHDSVSFAMPEGINVDLFPPPSHSPRSSSQNNPLIPRTWPGVSPSSTTTLQSILSDNNKRWHVFFNNLQFHKWVLSFGLFCSVSILSSCHV